MRLGSAGYSDSLVAMAVTEPMGEMARAARKDWSALLGQEALLGPLVRHARRNHLRRQSSKGERNAKT